MDRPPTDSGNLLGSKFLISIWIVATLLLTYMYTYPLDVLSSMDLSSAALDIVPSIAALNWKLTHLASGNFDQLFGGMAFYPIENSVLFNVNVFSTAVLSLPLYWITGDSYLCYEVAISFTFILCSVGMFLLARQLGLDVLSSIFAALIFSFSTYRHQLVSYGHLSAMQWMPFTLLFIHKYFDGNRRAHLYWAALFYILQTTASGAYFIIFSFFLLAFVTILCVQTGVWRSRQFYGDAIGPFLVALIPVAMNYFPYWQISHDYGLKRSIATQAYYGLPLFSFLSTRGKYFIQELPEWLGRAEGGNYPPGFTALLLTLGVALLLRKKVAPLSFIHLFNRVLVFLAVLTMIVWQFESTISEQVTKRLPYLYDNPDVVPTAILSPLLFLIILRFCVSSFARSLYVGFWMHRILFLYTAMALISFLVSLGPIVKLHDQQYLMGNPVAIFLYYTFPGLSAIRAISRGGGLIPLGLGISAGVGFMMLRDRLDNPTRKTAFSIFILLMLLFEMFPAGGLKKPYHPEKTKEAPEYIWLKKSPDKGPVYEWPSLCPICEVAYMREMIFHEKPLVNGHGSFDWAGHKKMSQMSDLSTSDSLRSLYAFGVQYLLIHKKDGRFPLWATDQIGEFQLVESFPETLVYINHKADTQFLPSDYWKKFDVSANPNGEDSWRLLFTFKSPDRYYVSNNNQTLHVKIKWEGGGEQNHELPLLPNLWRDGDNFDLQIKEAGEGTPHITLSAIPVT